MKFDRNFARPMVFKRPLATPENELGHFLAVPNYSLQVAGK